MCGGREGWRGGGRGEGGGGEGGEEEELERDKAMTKGEGGPVH